MTPAVVLSACKSSCLGSSIRTIGLYKLDNPACPHKNSLPEFTGNPHLGGLNLSPILKTEL